MHKTSIGTEALASLSLRVAPGQDPAALHEQLERRLRSACPAHATIELDAWPPGSPAYVSPADPVIASGFDAIERATGTRPLAMRSGGSIPVMAALVSRGHADDPVRLRYGRRRHPLAQREDAGAEPGVGVRSRARDLPGSWKPRCATAGREWTPSVEEVTLARDANDLARNERIPGAHAAVRAAGDGAPPGGQAGLLEDLQRATYARRGSARARSSSGSTTARTWSRRQTRTS